jgi:hypothetical protein
VRGARVGRLHVLRQSVERADERGVCGHEERPRVGVQLHEVHGALAAGVGAATAAVGGAGGWTCAQEDDSAGSTQGLVPCRKARECHCAWGPARNDLGMIR